MEERNAREVKTYEADLTIPLKRQIMPEIKETDCFGKLWDMTSKECPQCADRDICGIVYKDKLDVKAKELEEERGTKYLDKADLDSLTDRVLLDFIVSGETTPAQLIEYGMKVAYCDDVPSVKNKIIDFIRRTPNVKVKGGIVWKS